MIALLVVACLLAYLTLGLVTAATAHHTKQLDLNDVGGDGLAVAIVVFWPVIALVGGCAFVAAWLSGTAVRLATWWACRRFSKGLRKLNGN